MYVSTIDGIQLVMAKTNAKNGHIKARYKHVWEEKE
jgi:hypothetical protein